MQLGGGATLQLDAPSLAAGASVRAGARLALLNASVPLGEWMEFSLPAAFRSHLAFAVTEAEAELQVEAEQIIGGPNGYSTLPLLASSRAAPTAAPARSARTTTWCPTRSP